MDMGEPMKTTNQVPTSQLNKGKTQRQKCASCCKQFLAFLFSTLGLCCLMISYTILGGYIFMKLEMENEQQHRNAISAMRAEYVIRMWNITVENNVFFKDNWTAVISDIMLSYTRYVYEAIDEKGWDGKEADEDSDPQWSFPGSMLYSITVITTIGYGHIAPKTPWGRIATIIYAIIGIPLTLLTITNLGGFMASAFRFLYKNICCGLFCLCCKKRRRRADSIAYNDHETGLAKPLTDPNTNASVWGNGQGMSKQTSKTSGASFITWRQGLRRVLTTEDNKRVSVPIYISLLLISGYIMAGALLFTFWEEDWNLFIGCYFCFVTLTTIGFGDYVPGTSTDSWNSQEKLVLCALYLIFGLSLIAMCFDLMQEEVKNKCKALAKKMGMMKETEKDKQKKKKRTRRKKRKERSEKKNKNKDNEINKAENCADRERSYDSYSERRGKSPIYTPPVVVSYLPKYSDIGSLNATGSQHGSSQLSVQELQDQAEDNRIDTNFEDFEESKRPILLPKYTDVILSGSGSGSLRGNSPNRLTVPDSGQPLQITIKPAYTDEDLVTQSDV